MNNQFLQHLKSITPQGRAEETKIFIPADQIKVKEKEREAEVEELDEATRSKYLKLKYGTKGPYGNKVSDETIELARKKLDAAILRRGGATPEAIKRGVAKPFGIDQEVDMAKYRFGNKRAKHLQAAINAYNKKSSRKSVTEGAKRMRRLRSARFGQQGVSKELDAAYDKELSKLSASRLRRGGAPKQTIRGFFTDKPTTKAADKAYSRFTKDAMNKANAKGKKIFESEQLDELDRKTLASYIRKAAQNMENMGYSSGWKNAKNQFGGNRLKELDWERELAHTRQRKIKNRRRGIELATSQLAEGLKAPSWLKKDPRKGNSAFRNMAKVHAAAKKVGKKVVNPPMSK